MSWTLSAASRAGDRPTNQDQALLLDGAAAVLDGATSWLPQDPARDGGWYARMLGAALTARLPGHGTPLDDLLADAIAELREAHALDPERSPYSTATIARWDPDRVEVLVLGDSPVLAVRADGEHELVADDRLAAVGAAERVAYRDHLRAGRGFDATFAGLIAAVQRTERLSRNRDGGFWVAGADPAAARHAMQRRWPVADIAAVLLMSDGVAAGVLEYGLSDWPQLVELARRSGPAAVLDRVHAAEAGDPDGGRWPRTKRHDDKTLIVVAPSAGSDSE